jgi:hypothetical protein
MGRVNVAATVVLTAAASYFAYRLIVKAANDPRPISIAALEQLPDGITVVHEPETALATLTKPGNKVRAKYTWWFKTTVSAVDSDVQIVEFGAFYHDGRQWVHGGTFTGRPYAAQEFTEWYSCPDAILKKAESYPDPTNWFSGPTLRDGKVRWYYVGIDTTGRRVKGEAVINLKGEIDPNRPSE